MSETKKRKDVGSDEEIWIASSSSDDEDGKSKKENKQDVAVDTNDEEEWKDADFLSFDTIANKLNDDEEEEASREEEQGGRRSNPINLVDDKNNKNAAKPPPWFELYPYKAQHLQKEEQRRRGFVPPTPTLIRLHNEIVQFVKLMEPKPDEWIMRRELVDRVKKICVDCFGGPEKCKVVVFGSQATGLFLPTSDIDLVIQCPELLQQSQEKTEGENNNQDQVATISRKQLVKSPKETEAEREAREMANFDVDANLDAAMGPLRRLADAIRNAFSKKKTLLEQGQETQDSDNDDADEHGQELSYLEVVDNTRIPIVKFTHKPTNLSVDICINQDGGPEAAAYTVQAMKQTPSLRPLSLVLKCFLASRGLNEAYTGGIGSFCLQLMILSYLQHRAREERVSGKTDVGQVSQNLGAMLLEFLELYGIDFNYVTVGISVRNGGCYFPKGAQQKKECFWQPSRPFSLAMEHPLDVTLDVGRGSYRMSVVQRSFEVAFRTLLVACCPSVGELALKEQQQMFMRGNGGKAKQQQSKEESILALILPPTKEMEERGQKYRSLFVNVQTWKTSASNDQVESEENIENQRGETRVRDSASDRGRLRGREEEYSSDGRRRRRQERRGSGSRRNHMEQRSSDSDMDVGDDSSSSYEYEHRRRRGGRRSRQEEDYDRDRRRDESGSRRRKRGYDTSSTDRERTRHGSNRRWSGSDGGSGGSRRGYDT